MRIEGVIHIFSKRKIVLYLVLLILLVVYFSMNPNGYRQIVQPQEISNRATITSNEEINIDSILANMSRESILDKYYSYVTNDIGLKLNITWFILLHIIIVYIIALTLGYVRFFRTGCVIDTYKHQPLTRFELVCMVIGILICIYIESRYTHTFFRYSQLLLVFLIILFVNKYRHILISEKGIYYLGRYTKWSDIQNVRIENKDIIIDKIVMNPLGKIKRVENAEALLDLINGKISSN